MYALTDIRGDVEHSFPPTWMLKQPTVTTDLAMRMNVIAEPARQIMDAALLTTGVVLNALLAIAIASNFTARPSVNCYAISLTIASLLILLEPLDQTLRWTLDAHLLENLDYVFSVTFAASMLTLVLLNVEIYVAVGYRSSPLRDTLPRTSTAVKAVLIVWFTCVTVTAMKIHMYDFFEREVYVMSTVLFLIFPCIVFVLLDCFILYDLIVFEPTDEMRPCRDVEGFIFLAGVSVEFFLTMVPYQVVRALQLTTDVCCSDVTVEIAYTMVKIHPVTLPLTCFAAARQFRQMILRCLRRALGIKQRDRA